LSTVTYSDALRVAQALGRANSEAGKLISSIQRITSQVTILAAILRRNPQLAAVLTVAQAGIEVYAGFVAEAERLEDRLKQTQDMLRRYEEMP
jgi:hypothetical protein